MFEKWNDEKVANLMKAYTRLNLYCEKASKKYNCEYVIVPNYNFARIYIVKFDKDNNVLVTGNNKIELGYDELMLTYKYALKSLFEQCEKWFSDLD